MTERVRDNRGMEDPGTVRDAVAAERKARKRAESLAEIQKHAVQLGLDLLVREPDIERFFAELTIGTRRSSGTPVGV